MSKIILLIIGLLVSEYAKGSEIICLSETKINIETLYPPIRIEDGITRKNHIIVSLPIGCANHMVAIPSSYEEAIKFLDIALPLDFKAALSRMVNGGGATLYLESDYGLSVDTELFNYFHDQWKLDERSNVCRNKLGANYDAEEMPCYWRLQDSLARQYKAKSHD